jgi:serine/threonine-protein kinase
MSPEQLKGEEVTPRSDVYSVGVLLYHCLTGRPPFSGDVRSLARQHIREAPTPPRELNKKISAHMEAVILKALAKDPGDRYPSASAMLKDVGVESSPRGRKTAEVPRSRVPRGRSRWLFLAAALASLALLVGALATALATGLVEVPPHPGASKTLSRAAPVETKKPPAAPEAREAPPDAGASRDLVVIPDVRGFFDYFAEQRLASRGFKVQFVYEYQAGYSNRGVTWATDPAIGTRAPRGSTITVYATPEVLPQPRF